MPTAPAVEDAIAWMVNLNSGEATDRERREFNQWYAAHPANRAAWDRLSGSLGPLKAAADLRLPAGVLTRRLAGTDIDRRRVLKAAALGLGGVAALGVGNRFMPLTDLLADHATWTGERKTIALQGGAHATLGPRSALNVRGGPDRDRMELLSGDLLFTSAAVPVRPVEVAARGWTLAPSIGRVALHLRDETLSATPIDQPMAVRFADRSVRQVMAGQTLAMDRGTVSMRQADIAMETAWADGLLVVKDRPLQEVVASIRPYFVGVIRISAAAANVRAGGVFKLDEPRRTLTALSEALPIVVGEVTPFWLNIDVA